MRTVVEKDQSKMTADERIAIIESLNWTTGAELTAEMLAHGYDPIWFGYAYRTVLSKRRQSSKQAS
jgi:hypothetical protein